MRILVDLGHPGQVHQFKNAFRQWQQRGHQVMLTARNKEVSLSLLQRLGIPYREVGRYRSGVVGKAVEMLRIDWQLWQLARQFRPDVLVGGVGNVYVAHVSRLIGRPAILFNDTEHATLQNLLSFPFAKQICTPACYLKNLGKKQRRYEGFQELGYLHPLRFTPDKTVLGEAGLGGNERFFIVRFSAWDASHDIGQHGFSGDSKLRLVERLGEFGRVLITSEGPLPPQLEPYRITLPPERLHHLLYYATLYVGDGGTTASEAALLGTPAVFVSTVVSGYLYEEARYGLVHIFSDPYGGVSAGISRALELLCDPDLKKKAALQRQQLLAGKIDVTAFMVDVVESYA